MVKPSNPILGAVLTPRALRVLSAVAFVSALAMPWLAWWAEAFGEAREVSLPEHIIQYRPALVALPSGTFMMGDSPEEQAKAIAVAARLRSGTKEAAEAAYRDEMRHEAAVGDFELCQTEVTQGQWKDVMGVAELRPRECGGEPCEDEKPIMDVTWFEAVEYMNRLTERENTRKSIREQMSLCYVKFARQEVRWDRNCTGYRLPTEAEWEYAARAGSATAYAFGDDPTKLCEYGNGADLTAKATDWSALECNDKAAGLARVGSYRPNAWGLYDVHGNVWEWVWDWYADYEDNPPPNYVGPEKGNARVLRGGSFGSGPGDLRSANRNEEEPAKSYWYDGLRCARGPHPQP